MNKVPHEVKCNIHSLFEYQAEQLSGDTALVYQGLSLTYSELNKKANQLAHYLQERGVKPDTPVAICMPRSIELIITIFAILKAGGAYVPLDPLHPTARLLFILNDNNSPLLILNSALQETFAQYEGRQIVFEKEEKKIATYSVNNPTLINSPENLAYIIYTSGSTGIPKGVLIEHKSVVNYALIFADECNSQVKQCIDFSANYVFDMAVTNSIVPLMSGLTVIIGDDETKRNCGQYVRFIKESQVNIIKITPSYFKVLSFELQSNPQALPDLKTIVLGGENLCSSDCASWLKMYPKHTLINEYGPTETTVGVGVYKVNKANIHTLGVNVPIGKPSYNVEFYLLDESGNKVLTTETGELFIGGKCLARGYLNQEQLSLERFIQNPFSDDSDARIYKTGDLCCQRSDGLFEYLGRIDNQIKIRGFRVELGEIEKCLSEHPAIQDAVVLACDDNLNEKRLVAYYILQDVHTSVDTSVIEHYLRARMPSYMIPVAFIRINVFPLTANGKLDREALPHPLLSLSQHYVAPSNDIEHILAGIWSEELGLNSPGIEDNFFELGGHSLAGSRVVTKINQLFGPRISLKELYQAPTIKELAPLVNNIKKINSLALMEMKSAAANIIPLSDFQFTIWLSHTFAPTVKKINIAARKRLQGRLDINALNLAFTHLFKKHDILFYRILKYRPAQVLQKNLKFNIKEENLSFLSEQESEAVLLSSINDLINYYPWHKNSPLIQARLFYMDNDVSELQIAMPHHISDGVTKEILFSDLSNFYLQQVEHCKNNDVEDHANFKEYVVDEKRYTAAHCDKDIEFWSQYLQDTCFLPFPPEYIIKNKRAEDFSYSTYVEIPEHLLTNLYQFCSENNLSMNDALCASLGKSLANCCNSTLPNKILMNIVKSTRDDPKYDNVLGCFLRCEPVSIELNNNPGFFNVAQQVHQSKMETAPYQQCSSLLKFACINKINRKRNKINDYLIRSIAYIYTKLQPSLQLNYKFLNLCSRLTRFNKREDFLININLWNNFIPHPPEGKLAIAKTAGERASEKNDVSLFGLNLKNIKLHKYNLLEIDYVFDVCFLRDDNQSAYMVISANLQPAFRERIGQEMIKILHDETSIIQEKKKNNATYFTSCNTPARIV